MSDDTAPAVARILNVDELYVAYGPRTVVHGISFDILEGEIFGLLGPNGAGKTSTLSAIEGLLPAKSGGIDTLRHPLEAKARLGVQLQSS